MKKILAILMAAVFCACSMFGCAQKKQVTIEKAEDLNGLKVGVQGGTTGESWVQENCPDAEVASFKSGMDAALDLKNGGIDAVVIDELPASQTMWRIVIPQAVKTALPTYTSEFIALIKETSVLSFIAVMDLNKAGDMIRNATYNAWMPLLSIAAIYLLLTFGLTKLFSILERRLARSDRG